MQFQKETKYVQAVSRTLFYYTIVVDTTIITALSSIVTKKAKPMQETFKKVKQLLDYCTTQEEEIITYNMSKMILAVQSDERYCNKKKAKWDDIFSYQMTKKSHQTMVQF